MVKSANRRKIYKGYCFNVFCDTVPWPNGKLLKRDLIEHPGISVIVPKIDSKHILLVRQYRYGAGKNLWELPAGTVSEGEKPLACAKREIVEEIGYQSLKWKALISFYTSPGYSSEKVYAFLASDLKFVGSCPEDDEILTTKKFTRVRIKKMISQGKIQDAKSLIPLLHMLKGF